jgi:hypothetical protein
MGICNGRSRDVRSPIAFFISRTAAILSSVARWLQVTVEGTQDHPGIVVTGVIADLMRVAK